MNLFSQRWTTQPKYPVEVDRSNFFGSRLTGGIEPSCGWIDLNSKKKFTLSGASPIVATQGGLSFQSNGSVYPELQDTDENWGREPPFTIEICGRKIGSLGWATFSNIANHFSATLVNGWIISGNYFDDGWPVGWFYSNASYFLTGSVYTAENEWATCHLVFYKSGSSTVIDIYKNGVYITTGSGVMASQNALPNKLTIFDSGCGSNFQLRHLRVYNGLAMTPSMIANIIREPYQLFTPLQKRIYIASSSGSSSSIKTINGLNLASIKTVNGLAIASVKSVNGLL